MMAALPTDAALDTVIRYESHLSRDFARTLAQLSERQS